MILSTLICTLVLTAVLLRVCRWLPRVARTALVAMLWAVVLWPAPVGITGWAMSYLSHLSIATGLLALVAIQHRFTGHHWLPTREMRAVCLFLVSLALWFYPMSLGSSYADPYTLGFGDPLFNSVLLLVGLFAWWNRAYATCVVLALAQIAYALNLLPSDNLWDYLFDPWLVFWATGWLVRDRLVVRAERRVPAPGKAAAPSTSGVARDPALE